MIATLCVLIAFLVGKYFMKTKKMTKQGVPVRNSDPETPTDF